MEVSVSYLLMLKNIYQLKSKDSEIKPYPLCLGNISKYFAIDNMKKKTGLKGSLKAFPVDYRPIDTRDILYIHRILMKETQDKIMFGII